MKRTKETREGPTAGHSPAVRASISFPRDLYSTLEEIARKKKVSLAWVVRDAAEQYVAEKWPLFKGQA
jgi:metal-responsive CopG/Arc/MetJ family transcriptional regulator